MTLKLASGRFPTKIARSYNLSAFDLAETVYAPQQRLPRHSHERAGFIVVLQGTFTETYGRRTRDCAPSCTIFRPSEEVHDNHFHKEGGRCFNIQFDFKWLERVREDAPVLKESADFYGGTLFHLGLKLYREFQLRDSLSPLVIEGLALEMMAEATRNHASTEDRSAPLWLKRAREIIHSDFCENLTLETLAQAVGRHPVYLSRAFRKFYEMTVGEYIRRLRVSFVCRQLVMTEKPLSEIAEEAGFYDQSHFNRIFKHYTRLTPAEYRKVSSPR
jgi:AraC family transcriptional regulator